MYGWTEDDRFTIILIDFEDSSAVAEGYIYNISLVFSNFFRFAQTLLIDQRLAVVCSSKRTPVLPEEIRDWLYQLVTEKCFSCGISEELSGLSRVHLLYAHALFALGEAMPGTLLNYADCLTEVVISCYRREHYSRCGITPQVEALMDHDALHNSELIRTLYCYLLTDRSHRKCAEALGIHKSTL